jgi:glyoxylase-like metal-dependent hydrolase (beta-lactamase superfamily II)
MPIPLEDNFNDVIGKAQRGLQLSDDDLASRAGIFADDLQKIKAGEFDEALVRNVAAPLNLGAEQLVELGKKSWAPAEISLDGLAQFNTPFEDMTVNSYLVYDVLTKVGIAFDTGASARPMLDFARQRMIRIKLILLTHIHVDHIADLAKLKRETGAKAYVNELEPVEGAETFKIGHVFDIANFEIEARQTSGHATGGTTYVVSGLKRPVAVVGDALFASSMGGGMVSYAEALETNRKNIFSLPDDTILCPGHGPLTTVAEQKKHNPFYPEF